MSLARSIPIQIARLRRALAADSFVGISRAITAIESAVVAPSRELEQAIRVANFMCNRAVDTKQPTERSQFKAGADRSIRRLQSVWDLEPLALLAAGPALRNRAR